MTPETRFIKRIYAASLMKFPQSTFTNKRKPLKEYVEVSANRVAIIDTDSFQPGAVLFEVTLRKGRPDTMRYREIGYPYLKLKGQWLLVTDAVQELLTALKRSKKVAKS